MHGTNSSTGATAVIGGIFWAFGIYMGEALGIPGGPLLFLALASVSCLVAFVGIAALLAGRSRPNVSVALLVGAIGSILGAAVHLLIGYAGLRPAEWVLPLPTIIFAAGTAWLSVMALRSGRVPRGGVAALMCGALGHLVFGGALAILMALDAFGRSDDTSPGVLLLASLLSFGLGWMIFGLVFIRSNRQSTISP
jgi:hypothetical protein